MTVVKAEITNINAKVDQKINIVNNNINNISAKVDKQLNIVNNNITNVQMMLRILMQKLQTLIIK